MTLEVRPPTEGDAAAVVALGNAFVTALPGEWTAADVHDEWRELRELGRDWLVERGEGKLDTDGYVHPDHFGHGIGATLVDLTEARAGERAATIAEPRVVLQSTVLHTDGAARALLEGRG